MATVPAQPKIYHITHLSNLAQIAAEGRLWSDAKRVEMSLDCALVGMSDIKTRRLEELQVTCHPGTMVGQYVPFYFCPRSIMLYILHRGNNPDLSYRCGQGPIVHLRADLHEAVRLACEHRVRWAFTTGNAGTRYASFHNSLDRLNEVNWTAVEARDFRNPAIKEGKQAEFLVFESFPWSLVERIGVIDGARLKQVQAVLAGVEHKPCVRVERGWYF
jgi:hypothetical protein